MKSAKERKKLGEFKSIGTKTSGEFIFSFLKPTGN